MTRSLPAWTYHNAEFFDLEARELFAHSWHLVCHANDIPDEGAYATFEILRESIVVVRSQGTFRTFHNVCRHRGATLVDGPTGQLKGKFVCPYHAWSYALDGSLLSVPHRTEFSGLITAEHGLRSIETETFMGFIFVRLSGTGPSIAEQFAPVMAELNLYQFEHLQPLGKVTLRPRAVNWKQIADNYVDALHIPVAHPALSSMFAGSYRNEVVGDLHRMSGDLKTDRKSTGSANAYLQVLPTMSHLPDTHQHRWLYYRMWPGLAFDIYPDQVDFMQFIPVSATETLIREIPYALPDNRRETRVARYLNWRVNRNVNAEDTTIINRVQAGMGSSSFDSGPLADSEVCLIDSVRRLQALLPVSTLAQEPAPGTVATLNTEMLAAGTI